MPPSQAPPDLSPANILVLAGHPHSSHLGHALADAYVAGARANGHGVYHWRLTEMDFDPVLHHGFAAPQPLEPDLQAAQADLLRARHVVMVLPVWWGGMPAVCKGFFDRVLEPGVAFRYTANGQGMPEKLLTGRTATVILTMDTPGWVDRWIYGRPLIRQLRRPILGFCGIQLIRTRICSGVFRAGEAQRLAWIDGVHKLGQAGG